MSKKVNKIHIITILLFYLWTILLFYLWKNCDKQETKMNPNYGK